MSNRRRDVRIKASLRFTFAWDEAFELFRTVDVSAGGARVVHHASGSPQPPLGAEGECAFVLDGVEVRALAVVVREAADGFAVRFRALSPSTEQRIVAWIFRQEALALLRRIPA
ncbi:MAG: PilZ domain-containing protein [Myxococcus sp.]|nr:PilZ domain-containing protein [Myxococcus sp.]